MAKKRSYTRNMLLAYSEDVYDLVLSFSDVGDFRSVPGDLMKEHLVSDTENQKT